MSTHLGHTFKFIPCAFMDTCIKEFKSLHDLEVSNSLKQILIETSFSHYSALYELF